MSKKRKADGEITLNECVIFTRCHGNCRNVSKQKRYEGEQVGCGDDI